MTDTRYHMDPAPVSWPPVLCQCHDFNTAEKRKACSEPWNRATGEVLNSSDKRNQLRPCRSVLLGRRKRAQWQEKTGNSLSLPTDPASRFMQLFNNSPFPIPLSRVHWLHPYRMSWITKKNGLLGQWSSSQSHVQSSSSNFIATGSCNWVIPQHRKAPSATESHREQIMARCWTHKGRCCKGEDWAQPETRTQLLGRHSDRKCADHVTKAHKPDPAKDGTEESKGRANWATFYLMPGAIKHFFVSRHTLWWQSNDHEQ